MLHAVPLSPRKDIDYLVVGPTGIHAINTKASSYEVTAKADAVYADGYRQKWISHERTSSPSQAWPSSI